MNSRIEESSLPAGTEIRIGPPADKPEQAIQALTKFFSGKDNVLSAGLGLMEVLYPDRRSEFTYTIGIRCSSDEAETIKQAFEVLQTVPSGRWPISVVPSDSQFFPKDVLPFFDRQQETRGWLGRLMHQDLGKLFQKRKPAIADTAKSIPTSDAPAADACEALENYALVQAIQRVVAEPSAANRQSVFEVLLNSDLLLGVQQLPESLSTFPARLEEDTPMSMVTSTNSKGQLVLLAFTDRNSLHERHPGLGFIGMPARQVLELVITNHMSGLGVIAGSGWVEISAAEVMSILATN